MKKNIGQLKGGLRITHTHTHTRHAHTRLPSGYGVSLDLSSETKLTVDLSGVPQSLTSSYTRLSPKKCPNLSAHFLSLQFYFKISFFLFSCIIYCFLLRNFSTRVCVDSHCRKQQQRHGDESRVSGAKLIRINCACDLSL